LFAIGGFPDAKLEVRVAYPEPHAAFSHGPWRGRPLAEAKGIAKGRRDIVLTARGPALWIRLDREVRGGEATVALWGMKPSRMGPRASAFIQKIEKEFFAGFSPPGEYRVSLWGPACPLVLSEPFKLEESSPPLVLPPGTGVPLRIRVTADDRIPEPATIYLSTEVEGLKPTIRLKTEPDGTLVIPSLGPGRYSLTCYSKGARGTAAVAYIEDRVLVAEGKKQLYGTQFTVHDGKLVPQPIEDEENLDRRRAGVGLEPFAEYRKAMESMHAPAGERISIDCEFPGGNIIVDRIDGDSPRARRRRPAPELHLRHKGLDHRHARARGLAR